MTKRAKFTMKLQKKYFLIFQRQTHIKAPEFLNPEVQQDSLMFLH